MSNYRRTSKTKTEHIKTGFTVFQKTIATIGSILGLITASITIMNALDNNKNNKKEPTPSQTTIIKEIQKEAPQENNGLNKENNTIKEETSQELNKQTTKTEDSKARTENSSVSNNQVSDNNPNTNPPVKENTTNP